MILALSTSTDRGSLALAQDEKIIGQSSWSRQGQSGEIITAKTQALLKSKKVSPSQLSTIAIDRGPGSFTGCRISAGIAKTLAYTLQIPIVAHTSLDIMAHAATAKHTGRLISILDAHKSLFFTSWYDCHGGRILRKADQVRAYSMDEVKNFIDGPTLAVGDIGALAIEELKSVGVKFLPQVTLNRPQAKVLAAMVHEEKSRGRAVETDWQHLEPIYIRAPDAVEKYLAKR